MKNEKIVAIKQIPYRETLPLRQKILRHPGFPVEKCIYPGDDLPTSFHLGAFSDDGQLKCVATFLKEDHPDFKNHQNQYRLRGMATDKESQGSGFGKKIILEALRILKEDHQSPFLWCYAREVAFPFYEKLGFEYHGDFFTITDIGPHKVMTKIISLR